MNLKNVSPATTASVPLFAVLSDVVLRLSATGVILECKTQLDSLPEVSIDSFLGQPIQAGLPPSIREEIQTAIAQVQATQTLMSLECSWEQRYYEVLLLPHEADEMMAIVRDISDRKQAEVQIQSILHEKEILLQEIHHRVKNNLYIISNLLDLQSETIDDSKLLALFNDSQQRIQSMALIHEQLYQTHHLAHIDFASYLHRLVNNLFFCFGDQNITVHPILEVEPIALNLEMAVPCGLIVNELVTNVFKHAFPKGQGGIVRIRFFADAEGLLHLRIQDNGIGLSPDLDWEQSASLGLRLVSLLARQLKATLTVDGQTGTTVTLTFAPLSYRPRF